MEVSKHINIENTRIAVYEKQGEGPTLFFVHEQTADSTIWKKQWESLENCRLVSIDLPGHGESGVLEDELVATMTETEENLRKRIDSAKTTLEQIESGEYVFKDPPNVPKRLVTEEPKEEPKQEEEEEGEGEEDDDDDDDDDGDEEEGEGEGEEDEGEVKEEEVEEQIVEEEPDETYEERLAAETEKQLAALKEKSTEDYKTCTVNLFELTQKKRKHQFNLPYYGKIILGAVEETNSKEAIFIGHGVGGWTILEVLSQLEKQGAKAFLFESVVPLTHFKPKVKGDDDEDEEEPEEAGEDGVVLPPLPTTLSAPGFNAENESHSLLWQGKPLEDEQAEALVSSFYAASQEEEEEEGEGAVKESGPPKTGAKIAISSKPEARLGLLESLLENNFVDQHVALKLMSKPLKMVTGKEDGWLKVSPLKKIALPTLIKQQWVNTFTKSSHTPHWDQPGLFNDQLTKLMDIVKYLSTPDDITSLWIDQLVLNRLPSLELNNLAVNPIGEGLGFISDLKLVSFEYADPLQAYQLRKKCTLLNNFVMKMSTSTHPSLEPLKLHVRESLFYTRVAPLIPKLTKCSVPACYASLQNHEILLLEKVKDATVRGLDEPFDFTLTQKVVQAFALLNAIPHAKGMNSSDWKRVRQEYEDAGIGPSSTKNALCDMVASTLTQTWSNVKAKLFSDEPRVQSDVVTFSQNLHEFFTNRNVLSKYYTQERESAKLFPELYQCLVHGDFFGNNVLIKTVGKGEPNNHFVFLDWQFCHFGNPLTDLAFFLYMNVDTFTLRTREEDILRCYYDALISTANKEIEITWEGFLKEYHSHAKVYAASAVVASFDCFEPLLEKQKESIKERFLYMLKDVEAQLE